MLQGERGRSFGLRYWIMTMLSRKEMTGAMIIDEISKMSLGYWKPSPGSIYPLLAFAEETGFLKVRVQKGKKFYSMTKKGREKLDSLFVPQFSMFSHTAGREDSIGESVEAIEYSARYIIDNADMLNKDAGSRKRLRQIVKELNGVL